MKLITVLLVLTRVFCVENRILTRNYRIDVGSPSEESTRYSVISLATEPISDDDDDNTENVTAMRSAPTETALEVGCEQSLRNFLKRLTKKMLPSYKRDVAKVSEEIIRYPISNFAPEPTSGDDDENVKANTTTSTPTVNGIEGYEQSLRQFLEKLTEPCAVVVRSNIHPTMQSLLRKYRYDAQGVLIPSSVRYFIKVPQGYGTSMLVPLNDNSVSHLGGYVRYYKEVPPIPQAL